MEIDADLLGHQMINQFQDFNIVQNMDQQTQTTTVQKPELSAYNPVAIECLGQDNSLIDEFDFSDEEQEETNVDWTEAMVTQDLNIKNSKDWKFHEGSIGIHAPKAVLCQAVQEGDDESE